MNNIVKRIPNQEIIHGMGDKELSQAATSVIFLNKPTNELMTESELIDFLRIPLISKATDFGNAIYNLKRNHGLPCMHLCNKTVYPLKAIRQWIEDNTKW